MKAVTITEKKKLEGKESGEEGEYRRGPGCEPGSTRCWAESGKAVSFADTVRKKLEGRDGF